MTSAAEWAKLALEVAGPTATVALAMWRTSRQMVLAYGRVMYRMGKLEAMNAWQADRLAELSRRSGSDPPRAPHLSLHEVDDTFEAVMREAAKSGRRSG